MDSKKEKKEEGERDAPIVPVFNEDRLKEIRKVVKDTNYGVINSLVEEVMCLCRQLTILEQFAEPAVAEKSPDKAPPGEQNQKKQKKK